MRFLSVDLWDEWVASRPEVVRDLCQRFPGYNLYRLKPTDQIVQMVGYHENGTMKVYVLEEHNAITSGYCVFGIFPEDLMVYDFCPTRRQHE